MLENREVTMRLLPDLFARHSVAPVDDYPDQLLDCLRSVAPRLNSGEATIVILTPGAFNSADYEHSFLADKLGSSWSRAATCLSTTIRCSCAPRSGRAAST